FFLFLLGLTHYHGVEFNRAMLFLYQPHVKRLEGLKAIGQPNKAEAKRVGEPLGSLEKITIEECVRDYENRHRSPDAALDDLVKDMRLDLDSEGLLTRLLAEAEKRNVPLLKAVTLKELDEELAARLGAIDAAEVMFLALPLSLAGVGHGTFLVCC